MALRLLDRDLAPVFNAALAAVVASSTAFFLFAMPEAVFSGLVRASGLPLLLSAAAPPLGLTARLAAIVAGAGLTATVSWVLLSRLDRSANGAASAEGDDLSWALPRLRRADAHPDAPARRPLFAGQDLGEPDELPPVDGAEIETEAETSAPDMDAAPEPLPAFMLDADPVAQDVSAGEASHGQHADPEPDEHADPALIEAPVPTAAPAPSATLAPSLASVEPVDVPEFPLRKKPVLTISAEERAESTEELMARLPLPEDSGESISSLFQRLDAGLASCEWPIGAAPAPAASEDGPGQAAPVAEVGDEIGDKLRDALGDLQRMAGRGA
jgi:hypothetical protein